VQGQPRPDVFATVADLARRLDIPDLARLLQQRELIGIDESQVDSPLPHSALTFLKSVAFRMYHIPNHPPDEQAGPIVSELRMKLAEDESFESQNKLISYIRNSFVGYVSSLTALAFQRNPYVVLHGPLVRAIGPFSGITFDYRTAKEIFSINVDEAGEFSVPQGKGKPVVNGDGSTMYSLPLVSQDSVDGDKNLHRFNEFCLNLHRFNEFCLKSCGRQCANLRASGRAVYPQEAEPPDQNNVTQKMIRERHYPGFCLYFLEEARQLIPKSSGVDDVDVSGAMARRAMRELAYEGRKFSLGFGLISQKPSTIDAEVVSQSNTFVLHQLKSPDDQEYVRAVTESMSKDELDMVKSLGTGRAIVAGVAVQSPVLMRVYFRYSEEGIEEPTPIRDELGSVDQIRSRLGIQ
jgi:hypothetical protein